MPRHSAPDLPPRLLTLDEARQVIGCSLKTLRRRIAGNRPLSTLGHAAFGVASRTAFHVQGSSSSRCFGS